jgi:2,4-dienoyl-CoA reductase-like NADH-dependent reductase (Old Yellow Enzyme family)
MEAGIDAIEVHGDRLLGSLCSTLLNHRTDEYGGSFENRIRYALEVVAAIKAAAPTLMIEYKLPIITINPDGSSRGKGGLYEDEGVEFAKKLEAAGIDMIQVAQANHTGNMGDTIPPMGTVPYNWTLPVCKKVKAVVSIPVATVGINGALNAGILAVQMLSVGDEQLQEKLAAYKEDLKKKIVKANEELAKVSYTYKTN